MYYCLDCKIFHDKVIAEILFRTGYTLLKDKKVPIGICKKTTFNK